MAPTTNVTRNPLQTLAPDTTVEETPSLWTRITNCVSYILQRLWEWITCCCVERGPVLLTEKKIDEIVEKMTKELAFPIFMVGFLEIPGKQKIQRIGLDIKNQTDLNAKIKELKRTLPSDAPMWDLRVAMMVLEGKRDTRWVTLKLNQDTRYLTVEKRIFKSNTESTAYLKEFLHPGFCKEDPS
jgi:hypothetical protein